MAFSKARTLTSLFFALVLSTTAVVFSGCRSMCQEERIAIRTLEPDKLVICTESKDDLAVAKDFAMHLKLISGKEIAVNPPEVPADAYVINVGIAPKGAQTALKPEEARWFIGDTAAYFYGEGKYGTKHAVYIFLENELDVRWPTGTDIVVKKMSALPVYKAEFSWAPELLGREIRPGNGIGKDNTYAVWQDRLLWGMHNVPPFGHAFTTWWKKYGKTHPEYFAMNDGRRFPISRDGKFHDNVVESFASDASIISLCPSCDGVAKQIVKNWGGKAPYINICENDGNARYACHCPNCLALDPYPSQDLSNDIHADRYVHLANKVLTEARKIKPDVKVSFYAYNASEQAPVNVKMLPGLVLGIVPTDFRMKSLTDYVDSWKAAGMTEFKYRPNRHWYYRPMGFPIGTEKHFFDVFQYMRKAGASNFDYDAPARYDIFRWHNDYILQHAMSAPEKPFCHWERHFCDAYAGPAAKDLMKYFKFWRAIWDDKIHPDLGELANRGNWACFDKKFVTVVDRYYTDEDFAESGEFLAKALSRNLNADERRRMEELKLFHDHAALMRRAVATKDYDDIVAIRNFRKTHGMPALMQYEYDMNDFCGVRVNELEGYEKPFTRLPNFWHFKLDPMKIGEKEAWFATRDFAGWDGLMPIDGPWEKPNKAYPHPSKDLREKTSSYDGIAWYALEITIPAEWKGKRKVFLYFGAVDEGADVWCNGTKVCSHPFLQPSDWETPFDMEITDQIDWGSPTQLITVKVTDNVGAGGIWKGAVLGSKLIR